MNKAEEGKAAAPQEEETYSQEISAALENTEKDAVALTSSETEKSRSWQLSRELVLKFQPVPWFIWRLSNFVFNTKGKPNTLKEGLVLGLKRLVLLTANDSVLGKGGNITDTRKALKAVSSDVIAAVSVIHTISRKLSTYPFDKAWRPILDDAVLRAHVGFFVGHVNPDFGAGRGMLAGFAGRCGLAILIATGTTEQADKALASLASGKSLKLAGLEVYKMDPLQVSAMTLSAAGCGKDAALGTVAYASREDDPDFTSLSEEQKKWLSAFTVTEAVRTNRIEDVASDHWQRLGFESDEEKSELKTLVKMLIRKGHGWGWMM